MHTLRDCRYCTRKSMWHHDQQAVVGFTRTNAHARSTSGRLSMPSAGGVPWSLLTDLRRHGVGSAVAAVWCRYCSTLTCDIGAAHALPSKGRTDAQRQPARERRADGVGIEEHTIPASFVPEAALWPVWARRCGANIRFPVGGGCNSTGVLGRYAEEGKRALSAVARSPSIACEHKQPTAALMFAHDMSQRATTAVCCISMRVCARACVCACARVCVCVRVRGRWPHCYGADRRRTEMRQRPPWQWPLLLQETPERSCCLHRIMEA
jgi:hypothetical protein